MAQKTRSSQINSNLTISLGFDPANLKPVDIRQIITDALENDGCVVKWISTNHQPYQLDVDMGNSNIDLYIYIWRIIYGGRGNLDEKRIEITTSARPVGFNRPITPTQKTLLLGIYEVPNHSPVFAAWDVASNANHGKSKSCFVNINSLLQGLQDGIYSTEDSKHNIIYSFTPEYLSSYIDLLNNNCTLNIPPIASNAGSSNTNNVPAQVKIASLPSKKSRVVKNTNGILQSISKLNSTEKDAIVKQRIGQGLFRDLLKAKHGCKCALCDISTESMLVASHIKKWSDCINNNERLDENNGLLLCAHHDALFDKHLISFDENSGRLLVSPTLSATEQQALEIGSIPNNITIPPAMKPYMADHHSKLK